MLVARVQFRQAGKRYYFNPLQFDVINNPMVVVETIRGIELGKAVANLSK